MTVTVEPVTEGRAASFHRRKRARARIAAVSRCGSAACAPLAAGPVLYSASGDGYGGPKMASCAASYEAAAPAEAAEGEA